MRKALLPLSILLATATFFFSFHQQSSDMITTTTDKTFEAFELATLEQQLKESGKLYLSFLNRSTLSTGLYELKAGATDPQQPHNQDEVYYILAGKAKFTAGKETVDIQEGSVLFVAAEEEHKFHDIEEDLKMLVFFSTKDPKE